MGEKHLPAAESGDRQRGRGMKGERARGKGNEERKKEERDRGREGEKYTEIILVINDRLT